jgi:hypothetical protein
LNSQQVIEDINKFLDVNENEDTTYQNHGTAEAVSGGKVTAMNAYLRQLERSQVNNSMMSPKLKNKASQPQK